MLFNAFDEQTKPRAEKTEWFVLGFPGHINSLVPHSAARNQIKYQKHSQYVQNAGFVEVPKSASQVSSKSKNFKKTKNLPSDVFKSQVSPTL